MKLKKIILFIYLFLGALALQQPSLAEEKIEVIPLIQSSKGLSGKNFNYLVGKPELRLLKVKIPVGLKNSNSYSSFPNVDSCHQREIKTCAG